MTEKAFNNWRHNAIHLTFPNGNSLSTTWAYGSYSDNYDMDDVSTAEHWNTFRPSDTVEIMILKASEELEKEIKKKYDFEDVKGYVTMTEWLDIVRMLSEEAEELE